MNNISYEASRVLKKVSNSPIIWSGNRDVVRLTLEKDDYASLLHVLDVIENMNYTPIEYHRTKV